MRKSGSTRTAYGAILLAGASFAALAAPAMAQDQNAPVAPPAAPTAATTPPAEEPAAEIIVSGIRASLENSAREKQNSDQIKDVISAEDIGKLPDTNVAEAMQRVTGVQINRDQGEGSEIAVRGFSQNRVEINGQTQVGSSAQGGVAFNTIPSEAFKSIEVIKTPSADEVEGALGAIVRFNTRRPLDRKGRLVLSGGAQAQYAERANKWTKNVDLLFSKGWDVGDGAQFGALFSYTRKDRKLRQDFVDVRGWDAVNWGTTTAPNSDLDGDGRFGEPITRNSDGTITDLQDGIYVPYQTRLRVTEQTRKLDSFTTSLQYRTASGTEFYFNGTYSNSRATDNQYQVTANLSSVVVPDTANIGSNKLGPQYANLGSLKITPDHTVTSGFLGGFTVVNPPRVPAPIGVPFNLSAASNPPQDKVLTMQAGMKADLSDHLKVELQASAGRGRKFTQYINTTSGLVNAERPFLFFDFAAGTDIPTIVPLQSVVNGVRTTAYDPAARYDFNRIGIYSFNNIAVNRDTEHNNETAFRADFDRSFDDSWVTSIEFGARYARVEADRSRLRGRDGPGAADGTFGSQSFAAIAAAEPGIVIPLPVNNVLDGASGDFPTFFYTLDPTYLRANVDRLFEKYGIRYAPDGSFGFTGKRDDYAAYFKTNFAFDAGSMPVRGNVGVRFIRSEQVTTGPVPTGTQSNYQIVNVSGKVDYSRFLPSFNLVAQPFKRFNIRLGAGKALARPELFRSSPLLVISDSFDRATQGNPFLKPEEVMQYDLSLEKYYGRNNYVSLALFYKNYQQRIENRILAQCLPTPPSGLETTPGNDGCLIGQDLTRVETPVNVGGAKVKGFEAAWQQSLSFLPSPLDGLGFIANYTFVDAPYGSLSATGAILPVQDLSKHSYNLIGYYEKYGITARVAYNWRSSFYDERTDTNQASFSTPYGQLDASIGFDITPNITVSVEGLNLMNRPEKRYQELTERMLSYRVNDRRFLFGIRIKN